MAKEYKVKTLKNGEKRYVFDVSLGYKADGTRIRTTVSAKSIKEGRKKVAALTLGNNKVATNNTMTFKSAYDLYLIECKKKDSPTTYFNKERSYRKRYDCFEDLKINKIKENDIIEWINNLKKELKTETVRVSEQNLNAFFNWCIKRKILEINPFIFIDRTKKEKTKLNFWTEKEFNEFIDIVDNDYYKLIFTTLFYTGLRKGELFGLKYEDISNNEIHLQRTVKVVGKELIISDKFKTPTSKRIVPIPDWLNFGAGEGFIFKPRDYTHLQRKFKEYQHKAKIREIRVHDLRHSYVAMLISKGVDIFTIKEIVGHAKISMTIDTYGHLYPDKRKEITQLLSNRS